MINATGLVYSSDGLILPKYTQGKSVCPALGTRCYSPCRSEQRVVPPLFLSGSIPLPRPGTAVGIVETAEAAVRGGAIQMTQGRKIAMVYVFAVPAVLAVVLFQRVMLVRVGGVEGGMARAADVVRNCDRALPLIKQSELHGGGSALESNEAVLSQLQTVIQRLRELTGEEPAASSQFQTLDRLAAERSALRESLRTFAKSGPPASKLAAAAMQDHKLGDRIAEVVAQIRTAYQILLQQQGETATQSFRWANAAVLYGGFLAIWLVGIAAALLFHDERTRAWKGIERRVHTRILQELPVGVCLTTGGGTILYSNCAQDAILGYEPGELYGKDVNALVSPTPAEPAFEDLIDRLRPNQTWFGQLELLKKNHALLELPSWVTNLEVAGKFFRVYIHDPYSRQVQPAALEALSRVNGN